MSDIMFSYYLFQTIQKVTIEIISYAVCLWLGYLLCKLKYLAEGEKLRKEMKKELGLDYSHSVPVNPRRPRIK